jgi:predicted metallopeptidase
MIEYERDAAIEYNVRKIVSIMGMTHIDTSRLVCMRSYGSKSRRVLARCHVTPRIIQKALDIGACYIIEVVSENFEKLSEDDKIRTLIHEVMHIPKSFGGGFRHHKPYVNHRNVEAVYREFMQRLRKEADLSDLSGRL